LLLVAQQQPRSVRAAPRADTRSGAAAIVQRHLSHAHASGETWIDPSRPSEAVFAIDRLRGALPHSMAFCARFRLTISSGQQFLYRPPPLSNGNLSRIIVGQYYASPWIDFDKFQTVTVTTLDGAPFHSAPVINLDLEGVMT